MKRRNRLAVFDSTRNIIYTQAKDSSGIGAGVLSTSDPIASKMRDKTCFSNFSPSKRTMKRYQNEVKLKSALSG